MPYLGMPGCPSQFQQGSLCIHFHQDVYVCLIIPGDTICCQLYYLLSKSTPTGRILIITDSKTLSILIFLQAEYDHSGTTFKVS